MGAENILPFWQVAESEGFEPSEERKPLTGLAIQHLRPLGHDSKECQRDGAVIPLFEQIKWESGW